MVEHHQLWLNRRLRPVTVEPVIVIQKTHITDESLLEHRFIKPSLLNPQSQNLLEPAQCELGLVEGILTLTRLDAFNQKPMTSLDLVKEWHQRARSLRGKKEPLARAFGLHKRTLTGPIVDTTAGLGRDSIVLAQLGPDIIMLERELSLACLLDQALTLAKQESWFAPIASKITLHHQEALEFLAPLAQENALERIGGFYCDPMFEHKKNKSANNKRLVQNLQFLCSRDEEQPLPLQLLAWLKPNQRLVVKRAPQELPLEEALTHQVEGKAFRLDVHFKAPISSTSQDSA